jgi:hypothetical protein
MTIFRVTFVVIAALSLLSHHISFFFLSVILTTMDRPMETLKQTPAQILNNNQTNYFNSIDENEKESKDRAAQLFGIWDTLLGNMIFPKLVSLQPVTHPISKIFFYKYLSSRTVDGVLEVVMNIESQDITVRTSSAHITKSPIELAKLLDRDLLSNLYYQVKEVAKKVVEYDPDIDITSNLSKCSQKIHKTTMRAPANWLIGNTKTWIKFGLVSPDHPVIEDEIVENWGYKGKWKVFSDTAFPENEILLGYHGNSMLDAGAIWTPFHVESPADNYMRLRDNLIFINDNFFQLLKLPS